MSNRAWMPLHIGDYLKDTGHLSALEHGAYLLMIMHYWQHGALPADERLTARIAKLSPDQWADSRDILAMLFQEHWTHKRIDAELAKADEIIEKRRSAANARYASSKPDASAVHVHSNSSDTGALPRTLDLVVKEEPKGSSKKRGCRLPPDFMPDQSWAVGQGLSPSQAQVEADKFRDYWNGKAGASAIKLDWPGTWRNWVRSAVERLPRGSPPSSKHERPDPFKALAQELTDEQNRSHRSDDRDWHDAQGVPILAIDYHH